MSRKPNATSWIENLIGNISDNDNGFTGGIVTSQEPALMNTLDDKQILDDCAKTLERRANAILKAIGEYRNNNSKDKILTCLEEIERARCSVRKIIPLLPSRKVSEEINPAGEIEHIQISEPDKAILKLDMFPLVADPIKGAYNVYHEVKDALSAYLSEHDFNIDHSDRYVLVYRRVVTGSLMLSAGKCDNDNFEMQRVTNAITETIGIADSIDKFSFYYTTSSGNTPRTEVYLLLERDFLNGNHPEF